MRIKKSIFFLNYDTITPEYQLFHFYRVRKFTNDDYNSLKEFKKIQNFNFPSMKTEQDAWWTPPEFIKNYGRLNRPKESVLYLSNELTNSIYETRCKDGECFFVMVYESKRQMRISQLHTVSYMEELTELENAKRILMHNFLIHEFTKIVPGGRENEYMSSLIIYEEFFKKYEIDAFIYPSISSLRKTGFNIAFPVEKAKENLSLCGVMVLQLAGKGRDSEFTLIPYLDGFFDEKQGYDFHPFNSEISRKKFGNFSFIRDGGL